MPPTAYQAWLGYYNAKGRALGWDKPKLVAQANAFALGGLGLAEIPELQASTHTSTHTCVRASVGVGGCIWVGAGGRVRACVHTHAHALCNG